MSTFYHYTSIDALYNMLTHSLSYHKETGVKYLNFWATHISALNDTTERELYVSKLIQEVENFAIEKGKPLTPTQKDTLKRICCVDAFVISLSDHSLSDDLNMWRGYGGNGSGVCFELDFSEVPSYNLTNNSVLEMEYTYELQKCVYIHPDDIEIESDLTENIFECLNNCSEDITEVIKKAGLVKRIFDYSTIYKHVAYKSEQEWRCVCTSLGMPSFNKVRNTIKPYIIYQIPLSAITSITIGPCIKDASNMLLLVDFIKHKLGPDFTIKYSQIPYRG